MFVYHQNHKNKSATTANASASKSTNNQKTAANTNNPYSGWKTYCDPRNVNGCLKYPSSWQASQYGGFENSDITAYVDYSGYNNKDQSQGNVYIAQISDVSDTALGLKIVGYVYNNVPTYAIYNASALSNLTAGETVQLAAVNPEFQKGSGQDQSFIATPGANGIKTITNFNQARTWFSSDEAQTCLKVLQSFYYQ